MIKMRLAKGMFFDSPKVKRAMDKATHQALSKAGAFVRTAAKSSIRSRKKISAPGNPPSSHEGTLKRLIFFSYDSVARSVVIGPTVHGKGEAPNLLEFGGSVVRTVSPPAFFKSKGKPRRVKMTYRPRPFMGPAMEKELSDLPKRWRNSLRSA